MKRQIHITEIENGWLVMTPTKVPAIKFTNSLDGQAAQQQADTHYCLDLDDVADYLKTLS
jgi:hypothetical protein